jgi:hypothetical protein
MTRIRFRVFLLALALPLCLPGAAQSPAPATEAESKFALVIGNGAYKDFPLSNAVNDAEDIAARLAQLGFRVQLRTNASQRQMKQAIREFAAALRGGGAGLFFFAGHGIQSKNRNYLLPVGADVQNEYELEDESVDANLVIGAMDEAASRVNILILDACRNNPFVKSFRSASGGLAQMEAARGRQIPWISSSLTGDFYFRSAPKAARERAPAGEEVGTIPIVGVHPVVLQIELSFWDTIKASTMAEDFQDYLNRYPNGQFAGLAQNRLNALRRQQNR